MIDGILRLIIIGIVIAITIGIIGTVAFSWTLDTSPYLSGLASFLAVVYYVLPIGELSPIIFCFLGMMVFRIIISVIKTIWDLLPISG